DSPTPTDTTSSADKSFGVRGSAPQGSVNSLNPSAAGTPLRHLLSTSPVRDGSRSQILPNCSCRRDAWGIANDRDRTSSADLPVRTGRCRRGLLDAADYPPLSWAGLRDFPRGAAQLRSETASRWQRRSVCLT